MKMKGIVKWYKPIKGYGYLVGADGELYYFSIDNCVNPKEVFESGDSVEFLPVFEEMEYAIAVEKVAG